MARYRFGGGIADWVFAEGDEVLIGPPGEELTGATAVVLGGVNVTFWSDEQAGIQYTDLLDVDGLPVTAVVSEDGAGIRARGQIPPFEGPDGITKMWAQAGEDGPRALMVTTDAADVTGDVGLILPALTVVGPVTAPRIGKGQLYNDTTATLQLLAVRASVGTAPTTNLVVDVNRNDLTIFPTAADRITVAAGARTSGKVSLVEVVTIAPGDYLTADVDEGTGAADLVVQFLVTRAAI